MLRRLDRAERRPEIPLVVCIDVEPDEWEFDRANPPSGWRGFERFVERLPSLRNRLAEATGQPVAFSWFLRMDPQIEDGWGDPGWVAEGYRDELAELVESGDELGIHPHTWRWDQDAGHYVADYEDAAFAAHCVETSLDAFEKSFGRPCKVHRAGGRLFSAEMLAVLQARGVAIDASVDPGEPPSAGSGRARGHSTDFRNAPHEPYRSSPSAYPAADPGSRADPLLVPHASARRRRPPFNRRILFLEAPPSAFAQRLAVELLGTPPALLPFAVRSSITLDRGWDVMVENLDELSRHQKMPFVTVSAAVERLEQQ